MIRLSRILLPTDFSDLTVHALGYARALTDQFHAELHVIHVVDEAFQYWMAMGPSSLPIGPRPDELVTGANQSMDAFFQQHLSEAGPGVVREILVGRPFEEIIRYSQTRKIDLIVMGTHGRGVISHALMGSVAERVVRKAPCPVLTIRHPEHEFIMP